MVDNAEATDDDKRIHTLSECFELVQLRADDGIHTVSVEIFGSPKTRENGAEISNSMRKCIAKSAACYYKAKKHTNGIFHSFELQTRDELPQLTQWYSHQDNGKFVYEYVPADKIANLLIL